MNDEQIRYMANRFLGWKLPEHFNPDNGINFDPVMNKGHSFESRREPSGTNLFGADQATAMVLYMVEGLPAPTPEPFPYSEKCCPGHTASLRDAKVCGNCGIHIDSFRPSSPNNR